MIFQYQFAALNTHTKGGLGARAPQEKPAAGENFEKYSIFARKNWIFQ